MVKYKKSNKKKYTKKKYTKKRGGNKTHYDECKKSLLKSGCVQGNLIKCKKGVCECKPSGAPASKWTAGEIHWWYGCNKIR